MGNGKSTARRKRGGILNLKVRKSKSGGKIHFQKTTSAWQKQLKALRNAKLILKDRIEEPHKKKGQKAKH